MCSGGPFADEVNQGVLIGAGHLHVMSRQERQTVLEYLQHPTADNMDESAEAFRSAFLPMHCKPMGGKLYRKGDFVAAFQQGVEVFFQIEKFFLVKVSNVYRSIVLGDTFQFITNPGGTVSRHPISDTVYIQPAHSYICVGLNDLRREIMLFPETGNKYAVVDPFRTSVNLPRVIVPIFPQVDDFVCVIGDEEENPWRALITEVNYRTSTVGGYFYVKHPNFDANHLWIRERPQRKETIHFNSLLSTVNGEWVGNAWRDT